MSAERRESVLRSLASMLQYSAGVAKLQQYPSWNEMEVLAAEILQDAAATARENSETGETFVARAIRLLSDFELCQPSGDFRYH
jgi:hypothetical protein